PHPWSLSSLLSSDSPPDPDSPHAAPPPSCHLVSAAVEGAAQILGRCRGLLSQSPLLSDLVGVCSCISPPGSLALAHHIVPACATGVLLMSLLVRVFLCRRRSSLLSGTKVDAGGAGVWER
ncbi:unnamed protein product, partial [Urochloa humidicola]